MSQSFAPPFALSLSVDGIRLLLRVEGGWHLVGEVALDTADLAGDLAQLRARAEPLTDGPLLCKLLIPNPQIKYIALDFAGGTESDVRAALEGVTPYSVDELTYDWRSIGGRTFIAALARETLQEAEDFAKEHSFGPVCFAAVPEPFTFDGEAFFGPTKAAATLLTSDQTPTRDAEPVHVIGHAVIPDDQGAASLDAADNEASQDTSDQEEPPIEITQAIGPPQEEPEPAALDLPEEPVVVSPNVPGDPAPTLPSARITPRISLSIPEDAPGDDIPPAAPELSTTTDTNTGPSLGGAQRDDTTAPAAPRLDTTAPDPTPAPPPVTGIAEAALPIEDTADFTLATEVNEAAPSDLAASMAPDAPAPKAGGKLGNMFLSRRKQKPAPETPEPVAAARHPARPDPTDEAERMTVFGARKPRKPAKRAPIGGKPRFLGVILTAVLLLFMVAMAAWAAISDQGFARWFGSSAPDTEIASGSVVVPVAVPIPPPNALTDAIATEISLSEEETPAPEPLSQPQITAPIGQILSPAEAERLYAATGVWQKAPRVPQPPRSENLNSLYIASIDPAVNATDAIALPGLDAVLSDAAFATPVNPPPATTVFDLDENGLVRATAEGAMTPEGFLVFAGRPPVTPPIRTLREVDPANVEPADPDAPPVVAPGGVSLATLRPATRPEDLGERIERNALGGFSLEELAGRRPQLRPEGLAPPPPDPAIEELLATLPEDAPQEEIIVTDQAVAVSLRPDPRPQNFDRVVAAATPPPTPTPTAPPPSTAPSGPTSQTVAQLATTEDALNLRQVNLIGIYGRPNDRRALVRLSNGRYIKVEAGDSLDGGRVAAISESNLRYEKRGRTITLSMPSG